MKQTHTAPSMQPNVKLPTDGGRTADSLQSSAYMRSPNSLRREPPTPRAPVPQNRADTHSQHSSETTSEANILVFGETGAGKSSIINMLAGSHIASVSPDAEGHTFSSTSYSITLPIPIDKTFSSTSVEPEDPACTPISLTFWDTAGLSEGEHGTVPAAQAIQNLQNLVGNLHAQGGGISLLIFCIRAARFREIWKINYDLFAGIICQAKVPVVLVVNGLENESPTMENWWIGNSDELMSRGMVFAGHACITSTRGKKRKDGEYMYEEEYEESVRVLRTVIGEHVLCEPWIVDGEVWLREIAVKMGGYHETSASSSVEEDYQPRARPQSVARDQVIPQRGTGGERCAVHPIFPLIVERFFQMVENLFTPARPPPRFARRRDVELETHESGSSVSVKIVQCGGSGHRA